MNKPKILAIGCSNPDNVFSQDEVIEKLGYIDNKFARRIFPYMGVKQRHMFLAKDATEIEDSNQRHERYKKGSLEIAKRSIESCLESYELNASQIDLFATASCTGYLCPGLSPRLMRELNMKESMQHYDLQGMGCGAALPALQLAYGFVGNNNGKKALITAVEICSTAYNFDNSYDTITANAIFADGSASLLIGNEDKKGIIIEDFNSLVEYKHLEKLGFSYQDGLLKIILNEEVRTLTGPLVKKLVDNMLEKNMLGKEDIRYWMIHPGGKAILDNSRDEIGLAEESLMHSRYVLENYGNMSSPSVLFVLREVIEKEKPAKDDLGLLIGIGPGLGVYSALLRWE